MALRLTKGTKENLPVDITDRSGNISNLAGLLPKYDFVNDANVYIYTAAIAVGTDMRLNCFVDATAGGPSGLLPVGHYRLFVSFTSGAEVPRLGPVDVYIVDTN